MPDLKISQLPPASTPLAGTELVAIVQGGVTEQTTVQALLTGTVPSGTANGVLYLNGSKVVTSGSGLTFDGTNIFSLSATGAQTTMRALASAGQTATLQIAANGNSGGVTSLDIVQDSSSNGYVFQRANAPLIFGVNNAEQMRLTSTGLGIGTSSPGAKLDVRGASGNGIQFLETSSGNTTRVQLGTASGIGYINADAGTGSIALGLRVGGAQLALLDSSGNLGIGTNAPSAKLAVSNAGAAGLEISPTSGFLGGAYLQGYNRSTAAFIPVEVISSSFAVVLGITQAMTLDASGNLLVGTTTSTNTPSQGITLMQNTSVGSIGIGHANGTSSGNGYLNFCYNGGVIGSITQDGTTAVLYNTTSDQRLKENVQDADPASNLIDAIQVRQFDWKSDGSHQRYGMVAQELAQVAPEAVHQPADPEEMMAVDYSKLVPMLIKEIQSLRARVAALEA